MYSLYNAFCFIPLYKTLKPFHTTSCLSKRCEKCFTPLLKLSNLSVYLFSNKSKMKFTILLKLYIYTFVFDIAFSKYAYTCVILSYVVITVYKYHEYKFKLESMKLYYIPFTFTPN